MSAATLADRRWRRRTVAAYGRTGRTESEWVARWRERPDLFMALVVVLAGGTGNHARWQKREAA